MASKKRPAPPAEPRKYELKHRLTGAAILVSIAVITIPLLLKEPNIEASVEESTAESSVEESFKSKIQRIDLNAPGLVKTEDKASNKNEGKESPASDQGTAESSGDTVSKPALIQPVDLAAVDENANGTAAVKETNPESPAPKDTEAAPAVEENTSASKSDNDLTAD